MESDQYTHARYHSRNLRRACVSPKRHRTEKPDRLTNLPQSLILLILSLLPTKLAVRTSVLSTRWRLFCPYVPVLDFRYRDSKEQRMHFSRMQSFVSSVNHVLIFYRSVKIDAFRVCMDYKRIYARDVDVWLLFATRKSVEEVEINFTDSDFVSYNSDDDEDGLGRDDDMSCYVVPDFIFCNSSLVRLKLMSCEINYRGAINWNSLRALTLSEIGLTNGLIRSILSGSPSLEVLELLNCCDYDVIDINKHKSLRRFVINSYSRHLSPHKHVEIQIWAPFIKSLEISGVISANKIMLTNCSSLVEAKIDFEHDESEDGKVPVENLREILRKVCHVRNLTVGNQCLQLLRRMRR